MEKNFILGAGPAGMTCAMELHKSGFYSTIIEKDSLIGGLAKTLEFKEGQYVFRTDIGPHRFFSKNKRLYEFIENLLHEKWILVDRYTRQYIDGRFYNYPVNFIQAFNNIGLVKSIKFLISYLKGFIEYKILKKPIISFDDYIVSNFGKKLGEFNMLNYTEKIWGLPCKKIHPDWAKQRIKGLNLITTFTSTIKKVIKSESNTPKTLVNTFYYPQSGTGLIYDTIKKRIEKKSKILTNSFPTQIKHKKGVIESIKINQQGKVKEYSIDNLISSIPITEFINLLSPSPPKKVSDACSKLKFRSQVYLFITLNKKNVTKDNWIYFPGKEIPFGRASEMKNFSKDMSPKDKTSWFVEFFVTEGDEIWKKSKEELLELAMPHIEQMGFFNRKNIRKVYLLKKKNVYPIYDLNYPANLKLVKDYLDSFSNLICIGRPGRFKYNNQDHSLEMGMLAAKSIIENKKIDIDSVGDEHEYFEKGTINR